MRNLLFYRLFFSSSIFPLKISRHLTGKQSFFKNCQIILKVSRINWNRTDIFLIFQFNNIYREKLQIVLKDYQTNQEFFSDFVSCCSDNFQSFRILEKFSRHYQVIPNFLLQNMRKVCQCLKIKNYRYIFGFIVICTYKNFLNLVRSKKILNCLKLYLRFEILIPIRLVFFHNFVYNRFYLNYREQIETE